jgi:hypothetical protein
MFESHRDPGDENDHKAAPIEGALVGHPKLSPALNWAIGNMMIAGGAVPSKLVGKGYRVTTKNRVYTLLKALGGWTIEGHPRFCPTAKPCNIHGSTFGGSAIKIDWIGRGMYLEVGLPSGVMTTSEVVEVEELV